MKGFVPTNDENVGARLFLRFLCIYACAVLVGVLTAMRTGWFFGGERVATVSFLFVPLAAFAAFLTVSNTYLLLLTVCKGFFDAQLLFRITLFVKSGEVGFLAWNGCFFLTAASFLIFLLAEASAARFSFENQARDFSLLFSGPFFKYLLEALLLILLATVFYLVWPRLLSLLPTL